MTPFFFSQAAQEHLFMELDSWEGTPFAEGQCAKGAGVDCVRFAAAVLHHCGAIPAVNWPKYALRGVGKAGEDMILQVIGEQLPSLKSIDFEVPPMPGDLLLIREGGVTHAALLGRHPTIWHAMARHGVTEGNFNDPVLSSHIAFRFRAYL